MRPARATQADASRVVTSWLMRRVSRHVLTMISALSLLLSLAVCVLWNSGDIYYVGRRPQWSLTGEGGEISVFRDYRPVFSVKAHWVLLIGLALPAGRVASRRLRQLRSYWAGRNRAPGFCPSCGYDLRASPARCPECGTIPSAVT
jgi:hypothetical protein